MRFRAILQIILAVTVLSNACLAPMCQAECGGAMRDAGCHASVDSGMHAMNSTGSRMAGMKHCPMCVETPSMKAADASMPCPHDVCELQSASAGYASVPAVQLFLEAPSSIFIVTHPPILRFSWAETPPLHRSLSASSHTILRV
jgi:hypothetical protein